MGINNNWVNWIAQYMQSVVGFTLVKKLYRLLAIFLQALYWDVLVYLQFLIYLIFLKYVS